MKGWRERCGDAVSKGEVEETGSGTTARTHGRDACSGASGGVAKYFVL